MDKNDVRGENIIGGALFIIIIIIIINNKMVGNY